MYTVKHAGGNCAVDGEQQIMPVLYPDEKAGFRDLDRRIEESVRLSQLSFANLMVNYFKFMVVKNGNPNGR